MSTLFTFKLQLYVVTHGYLFGMYVIYIAFICLCMSLVSNYEASQMTKFIHHKVINSSLL